MSFDIDTIMKAIQMVGPLTEAGKRIYEGFHAITSGADQASLQERYHAARSQSDATHDKVQRELR